MMSVQASVIPQPGTVAPARSDFSQNGSGQGEQFSSVIRAAIKHAARQAPADASKGTAPADASRTSNKDLTSPPQSDKTIDPAAMSIMQQILGALSAVNLQMDPQQMQELAGQLAAQVTAAAATDDPQSGVPTSGQLIADLQHAMQNVRFEGTLTAALNTDAADAEINTADSVMNAAAVPSGQKAADSQADEAQQIVPVSVTRQQSGTEMPKGFQPVAEHEVLTEKNITPSLQVSAYALHAAPQAAAFEQNPTSSAQETAPAVAVQDIHEPIRTAAEGGVKHIVLRLDPPDLGQVHVRLRMSQGVLTADLKVDSGSTKDIFASALPQIRTALENSGIKVGELQVDLREDYLNDQGARRDQNNNQNRRQEQAPRERFFEYLA